MQGSKSIVATYRRTATATAKTTVVSSHVQLKAAILLLY